MILPDVSRRGLALENVTGTALASMTTTAATSWRGSMGEGSKSTVTYVYG